MSEDDAQLLHRDKVGPLPPLPHLPSRPISYHSSHGYVLYADGTKCNGPNSFCTAMRMHHWIYLGFSRAIPYGLNMQTEHQKLWFLGRTMFAPKLTPEIMTAHRNDPWPRPDQLHGEHSDRTN